MQFLGFTPPAFGVRRLSPAARLAGMVLPAVTSILFPDPLNANGAEKTRDVSRDYVLIRVEITPGKPSAPTEFVQAVAKSGKFMLESGRIAAGAEGDPRGQDFARISSSELTEKEYMGLCLIVAENRLDYFDPLGGLDPLGHADADQVFDFGERAMTFSWSRPSTATDGEDVESRRVFWSSDIPDKSPYLLFDAMSALARKHCTTSELFYLRPKGEN